MAILRHAMLCNAASTEQSGLVSMLGAFIDRMAGPELPVRGQVWLVARLDWENADFGVQHTFSITVERDDDREQIARIDGNAVTERPPEGSFDPEMPLGANLIVPIPLEFRRVGLHHVQLRFDGDLLQDLPLKVDAQLPSV